jgi:hypothetical protein
MISAATQGVGKTIIPVPAGNQLSACTHADHPRGRVAAPPLRGEGFPSKRNGAEKISNACFNARGFLTNFWPVFGQKTLNPQVRTASPLFNRRFGLRSENRRGWIAQMNTDYKATEWRPIVARDFNRGVKVKENKPQNLKGTHQGGN